MPVKLETLWPEENLFDDMEVSLDDLLYSSLHSDDIWKKFELLDLPVDSSPSSVDTESEDPDSQLDSLLEWSLDAAACSTTKEAREIRHHDCMWAGHCGSKEHKPDATKLSANIIVVKQPVQYPNTPNPVVKKPTNGPAATPASNQGRSLLLTSRNVAPAAPVPKQASNGPAQTALPPAAVGNVGPRPDSPPSSDDDDHPRFKHEMAGIFDTPINKTLQFLNDAISECDLDDDSDLCEYFEESDVFVGTDSSGEVSRSYPGESDHSYHKGKGAQHHNHNQHRMDHLGVQTPSDSGSYRFSSSLTPCRTRCFDVFYAAKRINLPQIKLRECFIIAISFKLARFTAKDISNVTKPLFQAVTLSYYRSLKK